jgi:hypothetical protein
MIGPFRWQSLIGTAEIVLRKEQMKMHTSPYENPV